MQDVEGADGFRPVKSKRGALRSAAAAAPYPQPMASVPDDDEVMPAAAPEEFREERRHKISKSANVQGKGAEIRRIFVPPNRKGPVEQQWLELIEPLVKHMKLQVRMNLKRKAIELRLAPEASEEAGNLQKGSDYIKAFLLGFEARDAIALLRLEDLFLETFAIQDVKRLSGDHLARCIGRLAGHHGKTRYAIENATRTRIVIAGHNIHILGAFHHIKLARHSICSLILGSPPSKVYNHLRNVSRRLRERM